MIEATGVEPVGRAASLPARQRRRLRNGHDARQRRRKAVSYVLMAGAAVLMVNALVGEHGYLASVRARRESAALAADLMKLQLDNQQLKEQIRRLNYDPAAVEDAARRDLGLIRPGETLVILRDGKTTGQ